MSGCVLIWLLCKWDEWFLLAFCNLYSFPILIHSSFYPFHHKRFLAKGNGDISSLCSIILKGAGRLFWDNLGECQWWNNPLMCGHAVNTFQWVMMHTLSSCTPISHTRLYTWQSVCVCNVAVCFLWTFTQDTPYTWRFRSSVCLNLIKCFAFCPALIEEWKWKHWNSFPLSRCRSSGMLRGNEKLVMCWGSARGQQMILFYFILQ